MSFEELQIVASEEQARQAQFQQRVFVCMGTACQSRQSHETLAALSDEIKKRKMAGVCEITLGGCQGKCAEGPLVIVQPQAVMYHDVTVNDAAAIADTLDNTTAVPVERLQCPTDSPFFTHQKRIVLDLCGLLNPERIEEYIAAGGYSALFRVLSDMTPAQTVQEIMHSGLRGRGGAGYPTGLKWSTVAKAINPGNPRKYVICNGDEGDPGSFMNRSVMEDYPFRVLEGMTIAAYAVGADQGYVYVRAEYPLAVKRMQAAIRHAQRQGLLGSNIGGTQFSFNVEVRLGAGAFVCGEETALIASIEGRRGTPRLRPPYPAEVGLWGCPTLINNVETFTNIVPIITQGAIWFATIGQDKNRGTKTFALSGQIKNTGLIEVPFGATLREIIFDIGGGVPDGRRFKAVQTGGPTGGCIPESHLDMPINYESLQSIGSFMGSGGMVVMDDSSCMVDVAKFFMEFCMAESCGKCVPCRVGTAHMHHLLSKISAGEATLDDLALLESLCDVVRNTSLCGLGQGSPNPVLSTLHYFRDEYIAHIVDKTCPAGVCSIHKPALMEVSR
jgi:bidirectional [NiFe] hydrogenase diaphorase subunit